MLAGERIGRIRGAAGVRWVRALTDVPTALGEIRAGRSTVPAYLASLRGPIELAVFAGDDPLPALIEIPGTALLAWRRRRAARHAHDTRSAPEPRRVEARP
jgi:predicted ATP-grasp superfamily ATP-dependent carboligase